MPRAVTHRLVLQYVRLLPPPLDIEQWWKRLVPAAQQNWRQVFATLCFACGVAILGWLSTSMWSEYWPRIAATFRSIDATAATPYPYQCRNHDCAVCLSEVDQYRDGLAFTGGSGGAYGFDLPVIAKLSNRKIANCVIYGTTLDGFPLILNQRNKLSPEQTLLHALNTWVMIDGGHFARIIDQPSRYFYGTVEMAPASTLKWIMFPIMLHRHFGELQVRWRHHLRRDWPRFAPRVWLLPLSTEAHIDRKDRLMQRWIKISPWALSFLQQVDAVPSREAIRHRLNQIRKYLPPPTRMILFNMPEYMPITQAQREPIFEESKTRFLAVLKEMGIDYLDIDYETCGLDRKDFWKQGPFVLDPVHPNEDAKGKITECFLHELKKHDVYR